MRRRRRRRSGTGPPSNAGDETPYRNQRAGHLAPLRRVLRPAGGCRLRASGFHRFRGPLRLGPLETHALRSQVDRADSVAGGHPSPGMRVAVVVSPPCAPSACGRGKRPSEDRFDVGEGELEGVEESFHGAHGPIHACKHSRLFPRDSSPGRAGGDDRGTRGRRGSWGAPQGLRSAVPGPSGIRGFGAHATRTTTFPSLLHCGGSGALPTPRGLHRRPAHGRWVSDGLGESGRFGVIVRIAARSLDAGPIPQPAHSEVPPCASACCSSRPSP
jgi:hypothetical protein